MSLDDVTCRFLLSVLYCMYMNSMIYNVNTLSSLTLSTSTQDIKVQDSQEDVAQPPIPSRSLSVLVFFRLYNITPHRGRLLAEVKHNVLITPRGRSEVLSLKNQTKAQRE